MYLNEYSVRVIGGQEKEAGYVEIPHAKIYALQLKNGRATQCDAQVVIDGKEIGTFRISPYNSITLQRSPQDRGRFTFYLEGTIEAQKAQIGQGNSNNGLISVTFTPELIKPIRPLKATWQRTEWATRRTFDSGVIPNDGGEVISVYASSMGAAASASNDSEPSYRAGATGLSGHSSQDFVDVPSIEYDYAGRTVINLRLVGERNEGIRPLIGQSNPIPPYRG